MYVGVINQYVNPHAHPKTEEPCVLLGHPLLALVE